MEESVTLSRESYDDLKESERQLNIIKKIITTNMDSNSKIVANVDTVQLNDWIKNNIRHNEQWFTWYPTDVQYSGEFYTLKG